MGIALIGGTGVGKSTIGSLLSNITGYTLYEVGHVLKHLYFESILQRQTIQANSYYEAYRTAKEILRNTDKNIIYKERLKFTNDLIREHGSDYFVRALIKMAASERIIIAGARSYREIAAIECELSNPFLVGLTCDVDELTRRYISRERVYMEDALAKAIFVRRHDVEQLWGGDSLLNYCHIVVSTHNHDPNETADYIFASYLRYLTNLKTVH